MNNNNNLDPNYLASNSGFIDDSKKLDILVKSEFVTDSVLTCCAIISIKSYSNVEVDKAKIFSENKDKSGIYM